ncbi:monogalactosyldiacylglycerol synthase [Thermincola ferriacetica]|uniref:Monogalactosyldiacylglycerol synthase n=2 Tax=Thermincola TaxID=278993 RepID=D5XB35_THEPJ|nr:MULTISPECIES: glycosyltransferase [Thermincola]ADG81355.1 Monogalactosyldiacylglycerol synthase [Thermincola potens JR]KNZ69158.1 monogalactosyldiacylglycerol synthase [Thermincola ferriacetica]
MKNVLFLSVSIGAGHDQAAQALIQEIEYRYPRCKTKLVDTIAYINPILNKIMVAGYMGCLNFNPKIWGYLYGQAEEGTKFLNLGQLILRTRSINKMAELIQEFKPQAIICTHPFSAGIVSELKARKISQAPLIAVITDFTIHPFWIHKNIDKYVIPADSLKYEIMQFDIPEERIIPTGIPIRRQFIEQPSKTEARNRLGLENKTTVLVMGGGLGLGKIELIVKTLADSGLDLQIVTVTGKNEKLQMKLRQVTGKNKVKVFGYVENMSLIMAASDVIVTKPGGLTAAEVLAVGLPMIMINFLPGQEERNADFLLNNGAAIKLRKIQHLIPQLKELTSNEIRLKQIKDSAFALGRPYAARDLIDQLKSEVFLKFSLIQG